MSGDTFKFIAHLKTIDHRLRNRCSVVYHRNAIEVGALEVGNGAKGKTAPTSATRETCNVNTIRPSTDTIQISGNEVRIGLHLHDRGSDIDGALVLVDG